MPLLKLNTIIVYVIIMCGAKMVHSFAVSNVVRGYGKYKDVRVFILTEENFLVKENQEPGNPRDSYISCSFD